MSDQILSALEAIREAQTEQGLKLERIHTALYPDPQAPGVLTTLGRRVSSLERWRSYLIGGWFVAQAGLAYAIKKLF